MTFSLTQLNQVYISSGLIGLVPSSDYTFYGNAFFISLYVQDPSTSGRFTAHSPSPWPLPNYHDTAVISPSRPASQSPTFYSLQRALSSNSGGAVPASRAHVARHAGQTVADSLPPSAAVGHCAGGVVSPPFTRKYRAATQCGSCSVGRSDFFQKQAGRGWQIGARDSLPLGWFDLETANSWGNCYYTQPTPGLICTRRGDLHP